MFREVSKATGLDIRYCKCLVLGYMKGRLNTQGFGDLRLPDKVRKQTNRPAWDVSQGVFQEEAENVQCTTWTLAKSQEKPAVDTDVARPASPDMNEEAAPPEQQQQAPNFWSTVL